MRRMLSFLTVMAPNSPEQSAQRRMMVTSVIGKAVPSLYYCNRSELRGAHGGAGIPACGSRRRHECLRYLNSEQLHTTDQRAVKPPSTTSSAPVM